MRPLYNKQGFTESGVCQLENIVTHTDRQKFMFYKYSILSVIIQIQNIFLDNKCSNCNTCICFLLCQELTTVTHCCLDLLMM